MIRWVSLYLLLYLIGCDTNEGLAPDDKDPCEGDIPITLSFVNNSDQNQNFSIHRACSPGFKEETVSVTPGEEIVIDWNVHKNIQGSGDIPLGCDIAVYWLNTPNSEYVLNAPPQAYCAPGIFSIQAEANSNYQFNIEQQPPCESRNAPANIAFYNTTGKTIYLTLETASYLFYAPTVSSQNNPSCNPVMCCQYTDSLADGNTKHINESINRFTVHQVDYSAVSGSLDDFLTLFSVDSGLTPDSVFVLFEGITKDSIQVTSN